MIAEGSGEDAAVLRLEQQLWKPEKAPRVIHTYGTIDCGLETMHPAWSSLQHVFSYGGSPRRQGPTFHPGRRPPQSLLRKSPVDLLILDRGSTNQPSPQTGQADRTLLRLIRAAPKVKPLLVLESWPGKAAGWEQGPTCKLARTQWDEEGYHTRCMLLDSRDCGGAIAWIIRFSLYFYWS